MMVMTKMMTMTRSMDYGNDDDDYDGDDYGDLTFVHPSALHCGWQSCIPQTCSLINKDDCDADDATENILNIETEMMIQMMMRGW